MVVMSFFVAIAGTSQAVPITLEDATRLVFRKGSPGIGVASSKDVALLDARGSVESRIPVPAGKTPLMWDEDEGLVLAPSELITRTLNGARQMPMNEPVPRLFATRGGLFVEQSGISFFGASSSVSFPEYDRFSAVGIDQGQKTIAHLSSPFSTPLMRVSLNTGQGWHLRPEPVTPRVEGMGAVTVLPGFNSIVVINSDFVAFIGTFVELPSSSKLAQWSATLRDLKEWPLDKQSSRRRSCYLFVTSLADGWTQGFAELSCDASGEARGPREGMIEASGDGSQLFILASSHVVRVEVAQLLKLFSPNVNSSKFSFIGSKKIVISQFAFSQRGSDHWQ